MKIIIYILLIVSLQILSIHARETKVAVSKPAGEPVVLVEAEAGKLLKLKSADLTKLPRREVRAKGHDGKESVYSGFELKEIIQVAGVKLGKELRGANLANFLLAEAVDGYRAVFALPELDAEFTGKVVILADLQDGKPLSEKKGYWQIIVPDDKRHARWVRQVNALKIKNAK